MPNPMVEIHLDQINECSAAISTKMAWLIASSVNADTIVALRHIEELQANIRSEVEMLVASLERPSAELVQLKVVDGFAFERIKKPAN